MSETKRKNKTATTWLVIGVIILIILLMIWLTTADLLGDTDVAAFINTVPSLINVPLP